MIIGLAHILHEGNEDQGKYGKQGWLIARRCIAIAMDQGGSIKIAYMDVGGRATQGAVAESSRMFPEFVQAQTVNFNHINTLG